MIGDAHILKKYIIPIVMAIIMILIVIIAVMLRDDEVSDTSRIDNRYADLNQSVLTSEVTEEQTETAETTEPETTTITYYPVEVPEIENAEFYSVLEAEDMPLLIKQSFSDIRQGYSGKGYVSVAEGGSAMTFQTQISIVQHYDITVRYAADAVKTNSLFVNGSEIGSFVSEEISDFVTYTFYGVFLDEGTTEIVIGGDGGIDVDYIEIRNNTTVYETSHNVSSELCNPNADENTVKLMEYLTECYGNVIITGQYVSSAENSELELIYSITGRYPAIRFADLSDYSMNGFQDSKQIEASIEWAENGGIVGLIWHWKAPTDEPEFYSEKTSFRLTDAMTPMDLATTSESRIKEIYEMDCITPQCYALIQDLDNIAKQLKRLQAKGIPVIWRPLHEASGDWFWWGASGETAYKWLWEFMYERFTEYHELNNLIWVWSGQGTDYLVDSSMYDIAAIDIYQNGENDTGSHLEQYQWLDAITGGDKLLALSECGTLTDINTMFRDKAVWSFFGLWHGGYLVDESGELFSSNISSEMLTRVYNSYGTVNLDDYINRKTNRPDN